MANNLKKLDGFQVLKSVYSPSTNCLRVCVVEGTTGEGSGFEVIISHTNDSIRLGDGVNLFTSTGVSSKTGLDVAVIQSALPTGAATEVKQDNQIAELQGINSELDGIHSDLNLQFDESQINEVGIRSDIQSLESTNQFEFNETQVKQDLTNSELSDVNLELDTIRNNQANGAQKTQLVDSTNINIAEIDSDKNLHIEMHGNDPQGVDQVYAVGGVVTSNSTNTLLGVGETFTGDFVDCSQYSSIIVTILTDQFSAIDGAKIEFSKDGTVGEILRTIPATVPPNSEGVFFSIPCEGKFFRLVYTNGSVAQTVFKLETELKNSATGQATVPLVSPLTDLTSTPISRTVITGKSTDSQYINQRAAGISTINSTNTPLLANAEFTGDYEECLGYSNLNIILSSDVASAIDGIKIEWSTDGVNVDATDEYTTSTPTSDTLSFGVVSRYFRIRYINGAVDQSFFRLQALLHITRPKPSTHRIESPITGENDSELVKAVNTGKDPNGLFVNAPASGISETNTTTALLLADEEFVGEYIDLKNFGGIAVAVDADQSGELFIEGSSDGITVNAVVSNLDVIANQPFFIGVSPRRRYARIRYVNGPIDQGSFDLQTIITVNQLSPSSQPINSQLSGTSIAVTSRSILAGQREDGDFDNVDLSNSSSVKVAITDRPSEVRERTHVNINIPNTVLQAGGDILYTVTPGKILYVTSFLITALNDSAGVGEWRLQDNTIIKSTFIAAPRESGTLPSTQSTASPTLPEPIFFTSDIRAVLIAGSIRLSGFIVGYEE